MSYDLKAAVGWITAIAVIISLFSYAVSLFVSVAVVTTTQLGTQLLTMSGQLYIEAFPHPSCYLANRICSQLYQSSDIEWWASIRSSHSNIGEDTSNPT